MASNLSINDPVHVNRGDGNPTLEGVVAYIGKVEFDQSDDWIGVRLTGSSVGHGKNDGSVHGKQYFVCPDACGMFVKQSTVSKRTLSRLEELRLRRELNAGGPAPATTTAVSNAPPPSTPATTSTSGRTSLLKSPSTTTPNKGAATTGSTTTSSSAATVTSPATAAPSTATGTGETSAAKNKLEELRKRRALLKEKRQGDTDTSTHGASAVGSEGGYSISRSTSFVSDVDSHVDTATAVTAGSVEEITQLRNRLNALNETIHNRDNEINELKTKFNETTTQSQSKIQQLESTIQELKNDIIKEQQAAQQAAAQQQQAQQPIISPSKLAASYALPEEIQEQIMALETKNIDLDDKLEEMILEFNTIKREYEIEKKTRLATADELSTVRAELLSYQNQIQAMTDQSTARGQSDASHYKERAKLQAEISNYKRKIEQLEKEKLELENTVEDITLDKEQIQEEKELLEDRYEELKLDAETAQMEVEELKIELEDARSSVERILQGQQQQQSGTPRAGSFTSPSRSDNATTPTGADGTPDTSGGDDAEQDSAEMAQALQAQNARLREALIRLREQSQIEKMELTRQLRSFEKHALMATDLQSEVTKQQEVIATQEEQINDLKDMVEQGAAFETMVEDLSDRVLSLEEDNVMLQSVIREMEEAAELTAEMEEVQADEIKALTLDLESHKVIIRNLEEAIKIQRRREDDFRRTVGNYKTTVETLKQEKKALLELQQGGEGEKSDLIAASQKALAKAAQLVADAAAMRKREATAAHDSIERIIAFHTSNRFEQLLPHNVVAAEVGAIRGELLGAKVIGKASKSLEGIESSFTKIIRPALPSDDENAASAAASSISFTIPKLSDEVTQQVATMIHQVDFAHLLVDVSSDVLRLLVAGQWPDLLSPETSVELGNILGHTLPDLHNMIQTVLKSLKEEGSLTVEQSNIGALTLTIQNTMQTLKSNIEREDQTIIPPNWNPPGWQLFKNASIAKFSSQGSAAALSSLINSKAVTSDATLSLQLSNLYNRVEQCASQSSTVCQRLAALDLKNEKLVQTLNDIVVEFKDQSCKMVKDIQNLLVSGNGSSSTSDSSIDIIRTSTENTLRALSKLLAALRGSNMITTDAGRYHALSPESDDAWEGIANLTRKIRSIDGDSDDVNFSVRTNRIESQLRTAVENEPKLVLANQKMLVLEKTLSSRSKEIAMQNARLSELEKILAKSSASGGGFGRGKSLSAADLRSSEEYNNLKEENRVLTEAMDVLQREVEMYENEIRALKDQKTPKRPGTATRGTPRRSMTTVSDLSPHPRGMPTPSGGGAGVGVTDEFQGNTGILEATLFRPALQNALREASRWKAATVASSILDLPPLPDILVPSTSSEESKEGDNGSIFYSDDLIRLSSAINNNRIVKASVTLVDLTGTRSNKSPRQQLLEMKAKNNAANELLETTMLRYRGNFLV